MPFKEYDSAHRHSFYFRHERLIGKATISYLHGDIVVRLRLMDVQLLSVLALRDLFCGDRYLLNGRIDQDATWAQGVSDRHLYSLIYILLQQQQKKNQGLARNAKNAVFENGCRMGWRALLLIDRPLEISWIRPC